MLHHKQEIKPHDLNVVCPTWIHRFLWGSCSLHQSMQAHQVSIKFSKIANLIILFDYMLVSFEAVIKIVTQLQGRSVA